MALAEAKTDLTDARLAGLQQPIGAGWANEARADAEARVRRMGLPTRRDEYWKFTNPATLTQPSAPEAAVFEGNDETPLYDGIDRLKLVFVDGVFDSEASDDLAMEGVEVELLSDVLTKDIHWAKDLYGVLETRGQDPVNRPLAALNTAYATNGVVVRATGKAAKPISLIYLHQAETSDAILHHLVKVEEGAEVTILENGPAAARFNKCMEIEIADTGTFHHVRAQGRDHERRAVTHMFSRLGSESTFKSFTLTANGVLTRNENIIEIAGDDAIAHVAGAALGDAANGAFHHDDTVFITHDAERCESRQVFKKVLRNGAEGVFQGKILVKQGAQKTDGYQISQALLLDEDSSFQAKPELEIYADDVICSHGSTTGAIDEEGLFYLRSRGVPEDQATDLLVLAFLAEAIDEIEDDRLREDILMRLQQWLERRHG
ncbi:Fe-S cluster assembly protein SufD [Roseobacter sp. HKCCD9010]|uniref:SufB/SufD family protein n=1 Tax=unclassified Roseobacter TaxID=196798 RepID=UPI001490AB24|nr:MULTISPECIES: SufD family Fe-S cluster assembly protein [unclassified Roseobacter]MBF9050226.1 Fe-S cluster assembly protein SufD [Rhodobacterales bacterium HKCCD4356]NNV12469.1 Fe-S cluster assembly protein SufD [Roseobacter sp. HKCCD7357]NNV16066.1 Fe-S cluster assembly protein SufD [Roseobacter sp. HKCCD8768]NNV25526.1 Fe-S cluster assembly protein SufD [Roseobacter sp. HKCCD8192]NNV29783.1 Fe-S cluster assembly protein SufD [Roseobacter sp. HKCCD9061]